MTEWAQLRRPTRTSRPRRTTDEHEHDRCLDILLVDDAILIEVGKGA